MRGSGEWEVRADACAETRCHFRTGITSVVPWLLVSDISIETLPPPLLLCCAQDSVAWLAPSASSSGVECSRSPCALPALNELLGGAGVKRDLPAKQH